MVRNKLWFLLALFIFVSSLVYAAVELDADFNGGQDISKGGTNAITASAARTNLGLAIGTNVQAYNANTAVNIASGTSALGTGAITSETCATVVITSATGVATTDVINWGFNGDPTGVTGYVPVTEGMLTIIAYPTANNVNYKVCNLTISSITPGAITLNWRVTR